ncbi:MAG: HAD-IA family hydrolase [Acidobacteriota bacterium]|nr:HAD-IA family hydrolase [Acidobacteriota bacterium]
MKPPARPCGLFLFDLDGTLIDSRADIAHSLNLALARMDLPPLPESSVADFVGNGMNLLVERSLRKTIGAPPESARIQEGIRLFKEEYEKHLVDRTRLYPHVKEGLDRISWARLAVVTNKPEAFSRRILDEMGIAKRFQIILGGDSAQKPKPDPEALFRAIGVCGGSIIETAMVGDSAIDIQAGKAAGVMTCGVLGGFRPKEEIQKSGCDIIVESLLELAGHFCSPG